MVKKGTGHPASSHQWLSGECSVISNLFGTLVYFLIHKQFRDISWDLQRLVIHALHNWCISVHGQAYKLVDLLVVMPTYAVASILKFLHT